MYQAELSLEDQTYHVLTSEYVLSQKTDDNGRPTGQVRSGLIQLTLQGDHDELLATWATEANKQMDGKLTFYSIAADETAFKEINFEGGYCVSYREYFLPLTNELHLIGSPTGSTSYCMEIAISAAKLTIDGQTHDNQWPA